MNTKLLSAIGMVTGTVGYTLLFSADLKTAVGVALAVVSSQLLTAAFYPTQK